MKNICTLPAMVCFFTLFWVLFPMMVPAAAMEVEYATMCQNVVNRDAAGEGTSFSASVGKLFCFNKIANIEAPTTLVHAWYFGDTERARVGLNINPPTWRTYSSKIIQAHEVGTWRVEIMDASGNLLDTLRFEITP